MHSVGFHDTVARTCRGTGGSYGCQETMEDNGIPNTRTGIQQRLMVLWNGNYGTYLSLLNNESHNTYRIICCLYCQYIMINTECTLLISITN